MPAKVAQIADIAREYYRVSLATVDAFPPKDDKHVMGIIRQGLSQDKGIEDFRRQDLLAALDSCTSFDEHLLLKFVCLILIVTSRSNCPMQVIATGPQITGEIKLQAKACVREVFRIPGDYANDPARLKEDVKWLLRNFCKGEADAKVSPFIQLVCPFYTPLSMLRNRQKLSTRASHLLTTLSLTLYWLNGFAVGSRMASRRLHATLFKTSLILCSHWLSLQYRHPFSLLLPCTDSRPGQIENALQEWSTGTYKLVAFSEHHCNRKFGPIPTHSPASSVH